MGGVELYDCVGNTRIDLVDFRIAVTGCPQQQAETIHIDQQIAESYGGVPAEMIHDHRHQGSDMAIEFGIDLCDLRHCDKLHPAVGHEFVKRLTAYRRHKVDRSR